MEKKWKRIHYKDRRKLKPIIIWRIIGFMLGLTASFFTFYLNQFGVLILYNIVWGSFLQDSMNYPLISGYEIIGSAFLYGYPLIVGVCFLYTFWQGPPSEWRRTILYLVVFSIIGPLTFINYLRADQIVRRDVQVLFNLFTVFIGYIIVRRVFTINPSSFDGAALQSITILLVSAGFIVMPLFYSAVFLMVLFGWIDHTHAQSIGNKTSLSVSGSVGAVIGLLNFVQDYRKRHRQ